MDDEDLKAFEQGARRHLETFQAPRPARRKAQPSSYVPNLIVELCVQRKAIGLPELYRYHTRTIVRETAIQEAKEAAAADGFPVFCSVYDVQSP